MTTDFNLDTIQEAVSDYKKIKRDFEKTAKIRLKSRIRTMFGVSNMTGGKKFDKKIDFVSNLSWRVSWARFYDYGFASTDYKSWFIKIGLDLFIVHADESEKEVAYSLLSGLYFNSVVNYTRKIIESYYDDRTALVQKSRDIGEKVVYKVYSNMDKYSPFRSAFITWIYNIAKNTALTPDKKANENTDFVLDKETGTDEEIEQDKQSYMVDDEPTPDDVYYRDEIGRVTLKTLFEEAGYPWQTIVLGFMNMNYKPHEITEQYADMPLNAIYKQFKKAFFATSYRDKEELEGFLSPLESELGKPLKEVLSPRDSATKKKLADDLETHCGEIKLKRFFGKKPNKNISDWNARSITRLRKELKKRGLLD